jgi:hypothetical protein
LTIGVAWGNFLKAQESFAKIMFDDESQMGVVCHIKQLAIEHKKWKTLIMLQYVNITLVN